MSRGWARDRAFSVVEAADIIKFPESTLRDWLASGAAPYASAKKGNSRVLSAADIYVLSIAKWLVAAGYSILVGTAEAWRVCGGPDADPQNVGLEEVVIGELGGAEMGTVYLAHEIDIPEHVHTRGVAYIPAGRIARQIVRATLEAYGERVSMQDIAQVVGICSQRTPEEIEELGAQALAHAKQHRAQREAS